MKKRTGRKSQKPPPARRAAKARAGKLGSRAPKLAAGPRHLHYKIVELSNVDEGTLERTLNEWVPQGWTFDGVQFAMRESSKRPAMAFVFLTREGEAAPRGDDSARERLRRLAEGTGPGRVAVPAPPAQVSAYERLRQMAGEASPSSGPSGAASADDELFPLGRDE